MEQGEHSGGVLAYDRGCIILGMGCDYIVIRGRPCWDWLDGSLVVWLNCPDHYNRGEQHRKQGWEP